MPQTPPWFPPPDAVRHVLAKLDKADLTLDERELIEGIAKNYLELMALARKPGVTLTELRSRVRYRIVP